MNDEDNDSMVNTIATQMADAIERPILQFENEPYARYQLPFRMIMQCVRVFHGMPFGNLILALAVLAIPVSMAFDTNLFAILGLITVGAPIVVAVYLTQLMLRAPKVKTRLAQAEANHGVSD